MNIARRKVKLMAFLAGTVLAGAAHAQQLTMGAQVEPTSLDPHFANIDTNNAMAQHSFSPLVIRDDQTLQPTPGLAVSWKAVDDTTWEFKLREGVKFHDGTPFTAEDVKFSIQRAPNVPNSPSSLAVYLRPVKSVDILDPYTIRLKTETVFPLMPIYMGTFVIVSKKAAENATTEDFNSGKAMIGTGPYKFVRWSKGNQLVMARFDDYWGPKPDFENVTIKFIGSAPARVAALRSGDVDMIDFVPTTDILTLTATRGLKLMQGVTNRLLYLTVDSFRDNSPNVTRNDGTPYTDKGPLRNPKVREAISAAIDRKAISERIMDGASLPTGQLMPKGFNGYLPDVPAPAHDLERAKKLLVEAGFADGFKVTVHVPNQRYVNDVQTMEAVAQMLARVNITVKVDTVPIANFFTRASNMEFSLFMIGFGIVTGEPSSVMSFILASYDKEKGLGVGNRGRYSNAQVDALLKQAQATVDDAKREKLLQDATRIALQEQAIIPLYHQVHTWAMKDTLSFKPRTDEYTYAHNLSKAK